MLPAFGANPVYHRKRKVVTLLSTKTSKAPFWHSSHNALRLRPKAAFVCSFGTHTYWHLGNSKWKLGDANAQKKPLATVQSRSYSAISRSWPWIFSNIFLNPLVIPTAHIYMWQLHLKWTHNVISTSTTQCDYKLYNVTSTSVICWVLLISSFGFYLYDVNFTCSRYFFIICTI